MWTETVGGIAKPHGFLAAATHAGFKKKKLDLALITCKDAEVAGYSPKRFRRKSC